MAHRIAFSSCGHGRYCMVRPRAGECSSYLVLQPVHSRSRVAGEDFDEIISGLLLCRLLCVFEESFGTVLDALLGLSAGALSGVSGWWIRGRGVRWGKGNSEWSVLYISLAVACATSSLPFLHIVNGGRAAFCVFPLPSSKPFRRHDPNSPPAVDTTLSTSRRPHPPTYSTVDTRGGLGGVTSEEPVLVEHW